MILKKLEIGSKSRKKIVLVLGALIVFAVVLEIWAVNRLATFGLQISELEKNKNTLVLENQVLENEIAKKTSLLEVSKEASGLGFEKIKQIEYIEDHNLALNY